MEDIPGWCAGVKVSLTSFDLPKSGSDKEILEDVGDCGGSVAVVSVNVEETSVIAFLKKNGWSKGRWFKNWIHGGRKTCLYYKQIPKTLYNKDY